MGCIVYVSGAYRPGGGRLRMPGGVLIGLPSEPIAGVPGPAPLGGGVFQWDLSVGSGPVLVFSPQPIATMAIAITASSSKIR